MIDDHMETHSENNQDDHEDGMGISMSQEEQAAQANL